MSDTQPSDPQTSYGMRLWKYVHLFDFLSQQYDIPIFKKDDILDRARHLMPSLTAIPDDRDTVAAIVHAVVHRTRAVVPSSVLTRTQLDDPIHIAAIFFRHRESHDDADIGELRRMGIANSRAPEPHALSSMTIMANQGSSAVDEEAAEATDAAEAMQSRKLG
ncbi:hypothetical protein EK21DRAFT_86785 [Setomelanomma holmii]|uniref:Uncharacterized protein n=1 Tax=Setomelanomma holmii TaxID=210430 RepID=A0A9P4HFN2_9PLEO|nr:hypothetical protein EK21DRAFT_86785 [Setomelanomma holmii]